MDQANHFLANNDIEISDIKYIIREEGKTSVYTNDGRIFKTYIPVKSFIMLLSTENFININKGVLLSRASVAEVHKSVYTTADGRTFDGRHRALREHLKNEIALSLPSASINQRYSMLDKMPLAFCVIEPVYNNKGVFEDFVFQYCNEHFASIIHAPVCDLIGKSFKANIKVYNRKRLMRLCSVAEKGGDRVVRDYIADSENFFDIYCFQPEKGLCACVVIEE